MRLRTPSRLSTPICCASRRASERAAAARCVLSRSSENGNIDDDDGTLSGESDWAEWDEDEDEGDEEGDLKRENGKTEDGRTDVGETMETIVIGRLGNKPPTNAKTPNKRIRLSFFPFSFHSPLSRFDAPKPSAHSVW